MRTGCSRRALHHRILGLLGFWAPIDEEDEDRRRRYDRIRGNSCLRLWHVLGAECVAFRSMIVLLTSVVMSAIAPWVYLGESFPLRVRAKAIALGSATKCV